MQFQGVGGHFPQLGDRWSSGSGCEGREDDPVAQDPRVDEVECRCRSGPGEQFADVARPNELRMDPQLELIEEAVFEQESGTSPATSTAGMPRDSNSTAVSARRIWLIIPRVSPVTRERRRSTERVDRPSTSPCNAADATGSCTIRPSRTSLSTKTSALSCPGSSHAEPLSQHDMVVAGGNVNARSTRWPGSSVGMKVPTLNRMPRNSASSGMGTVVAFVSGPRTVSRAAPRCRVTTISQWTAATEMNDFSGSLRVHHVSSTKGELDDRRSNANSSTAARHATSTCGDG